MRTFSKDRKSRYGETHTLTVCDEGDGAYIQMRRTDSTDWIWVSLTNEERKALRKALKRA